MWKELLEPLFVGLKWVIIISTVGWWVLAILKGIVDYLLSEENKK